MRIQSDRPFVLKNSGETGYWHKLDGSVQRPPMPVRKEPPKIDAAALMDKWRRGGGNVIGDLARSLGVSTGSLMELYVEWAPEYQSWAFPMRDGNGVICGIRLRRDDGGKFCVTGSRTGIFLPYCPPEKTAYLVEGPTDCAAMLTIGLYSIGRPSNSGGLDIIKQTILRLGIQKAVIIADNDEDKYVNGKKFNPGYDGAKSLARNLGIPCCIMALPTKDAREFVRNKGTAAMLESQAANMVWENH